MEDRGKRRTDIGDGWFRKTRFKERCHDFSTQHQRKMQVRGGVDERVRGRKNKNSLKPIGTSGAGITKKKTLRRATGEN